MRPSGPIRTGPAATDLCRRAHDSIDRAEALCARSIALTGAARARVVEVRRLSRTRDGRSGRGNASGPPGSPGADVFVVAGFFDDVPTRAPELGDPFECPGAGPPCASLDRSTPALLTASRAFSRVVSVDVDSPAPAVEAGRRER